MIATPTLLIGTSGCTGGGCRLTFLSCCNPRVSCCCSGGLLTPQFLHECLQPHFYTYFTTASLPLTRLLGSDCPTLFCSIPNAFIMYVVYHKSHPVSPTSLLRFPCSPQLTNKKQIFRQTSSSHARHEQPCVQKASLRPGHSDGFLHSTLDRSPAYRI